MTAKEIADYYIEASANGRFGKTSNEYVLAEAYLNACEMLRKLSRLSAEGELCRACEDRIYETIGI